MLGLGSAFYAGSKTWVAPVILSQSDKETLDLTCKTLTTQDTVDGLKLDIGKPRWRKPGRTRQNLKRFSPPSMRRTLALSNRVGKKRHFAELVATRQKKGIIDGLQQNVQVLQI